MDDLIDRAWARWIARGEVGQGSLEYGLIILLVAMVVFAALTLFGPAISNVFNTAGSSLP